ncbi:Ricin B lectin [Catenulispora acidiphila DSM 44928]|uniref:Ricin B lectin n=1 Tax=Catenulispora acidiphila (strain DSM 44928 / JCM 14897 / NBRC 102108 / NRRL B-24433 / ID139908) TaxID=479433 RepID=C7QC67_CATAD|nr:RICIN domain-containing protein [Catenulispora acidiphila]ACU74515.1 Ricin B lectin [Catenulispora acidiphila DSM 44928]
MRLRKTLLAALAAGALACVGAVAPGSASAAPPSATYTVSIGSNGTFSAQSDSPAGAFVDRDGTFYFQESYSGYGSSDGRVWQFYSGSDFDSASLNSTISNSVNPANSQDANNNTTWRCDNSPTGLASTSAGSGSGYTQPNFCDLIGMWVDPDTGNWIGLVHNEFTPQPFGDGLHYDAIDYAVSTDRGMTWKITGHAITSPYSTKRNDTTAFPNQTYNYGDGDQRLYVDTASGYFYVYYGSRVVPKGGVGGSTGGLAHVARAPISGKMATGTWQKWYNGAWSQPGVGGLESNMVPVDSTNPTGYTAPAHDYNPANTGTVDQQVAAGQLPAKSPLFIMNITYDAYLGLYVGTPEVVSGTQPQQYYVTDDLSTQKWYYVGNSGSAYTQGSWYRWFADSGDKWNPTIVGKSFRAYCSVACVNNAGSLYTNETIDSTAPAQPPVDTTKTYTIGTSAGRVLAQVSGGSSVTSDAAASGSALEAWQFTANGDGSYRITNASTGQALGVTAATAGRAWGAAPTATALSGGTGSVGQQWWIVPVTGQSGSYKLVNRYSGLVLALSSNTSRLAETTPTRAWTDTSGTGIGGGRTAAEQTLAFTPATSSGTETVTVANPGTQTTTVSTAVSLQITASDSKNKALTYSATGLPAGLSISSAGKISGTPSATGSASVTVTASSGTATGSTTFTWTVGPAAANLTGTHTLTASGQALDDPNHSTTTGTQLVTWSPNGGSNQNWVFTQQSDGSYQIQNQQSQLCMDDNGGFTTAGTSVIQWTCTGSANQHWTATRLAGGAYTLTNVHSGLLVTTASTANGALVTQETNSGSALQQWTVG